MHAYLVGDVRAGLADVPAHLSHDADVLVAVQEGVLLVAGGGADATGTARGSIECHRVAAGAKSLEAGVGEHHDETLGALVGCRDGGVLCGYQRWQSRRR